MFQQIGSVIIALWLVLPGLSFADADLAREIAQMVESDVLDACDDESFTECLQTRPANCKSAMNSAIKACRAKLPTDVSEEKFDKDPDSVTADWMRCVNAKISTTLKISIKAVNDCNSVDTEDGGEQKGR